MKAKITIGLIFAAIVGMALPFPCLISAGEDVIIVANKNAPADTMSYRDIKNIFLGHKTKWSNGQKIIIASLSGSETHKTFLKKYIQKSPSQFKRYYKSLVFTGKGKMPRSFSTQESALKFVTNTDGAIGYISSQLANDGVRIVTVN